LNPAGEFLIGLVILVGLAGIVVPVLPGLVLVLGGVFVWALEESSALGWAVMVVAAAIAVGASIVKYLIPGRNLKAAGIPTSTMLLAAVGAFVGFFAIPVVGAAIGFIAAIYLVEWGRRGRSEAWPATRKTASAVALSIGIELAGGLLIFGLWLVAAVFG
jgi:uncharacterized protein